MTGVVGECLQTGRCASHSTGLQIDCAHCGFYSEEHERRQRLPMILDETTGLRHKVLPRRRERSDAERGD